VIHSVLAFHHPKLAAFYIAAQRIVDINFRGDKKDY
jgi:hypothetical protein